LSIAKWFCETADGVFEPALGDLADFQFPLFGEFITSAFDNMSMITHGAGVRVFIQLTRL